MPKKPRKPRRKKVDRATRGLRPAEMKAEIPAELRALAAQVEGDGGAVLGAYRDPLAGRGLLLAALPIEHVKPTPYQRDLSAAHLRRLADVVEKVGMFLDPIIATREGEKDYWTPNGNHRRAAMEQLGAKSITALVVPDREVAFKILALNTEKSHNLREKALEVVRMARALAIDSDRKESELALEFEDPVLLTLGLCYEQNGRFSGGAYRPALRRVEEFQATALPKALAVREARAAALMELDARVSEIVAKLKERGMTSPYLRPFVTARINPIRFAKEVSLSPEELIAKMAAAAKKFDPNKVTQAQLASVAAFGAEPEE